MNWWKTLEPRWTALAPRERNGLLGAAGVVLLALVWWLLLNPAWQVLSAAEGQHQQLDTQLQGMRRMQAEALALQSQPKMSYDDALRALENSVKQRLPGTGQLSVSGERATVTLKNAPADALARWLSQARVNARALPAEARLTRSPSSAADTGARWDGSVVLTLPSR